MIDPSVAFVPTALYGAAVAACAFDLVRPAKAARSAGLVCTVLGLLARIATFLEPGLCPVSATGSSIGIVGLFLALHLAFGFHLDGSQRAKTLVVAAIVFALDLAAKLLSPGGAPVHPPQAERALGEIHGGLVLLAYASFIIAGVYAGLYLLLYRLMKRRRLGFWFTSLPSLERLERKCSIACWIGFLALSLGLGVGIGSFAVFHGGLPFGDPKFGGALAMWVLYAGELLLRHAFGWRGVRLMWLPLLGVVVLAILYSVSSTDHPFWNAP